MLPAASPYNRAACEHYRRTWQKAVSLSQLSTASLSQELTAATVFWLVPTRSPADRFEQNDTGYWSSVITWTARCVLFPVSESFVIICWPMTRSYMHGVLVSRSNFFGPLCTNNWALFVASRRDHCARRTVLGSAAGAVHIVLAASSSQVI